MPPDYSTALANHPFPLTQQDDTIIFTSPHSILLATNLLSQKHKGHIFTLNDYVQGGTPSQRNALLDETMLYMQSVNRSNPNLQLDIWSDFSDSSVCAIEDARGKYEVRQKDGTFRAETLDDVVGELIAGRYRKLQIRGLAREKKEFFTAIRRRIEGLEIIVGRDVTRVGAVEFGDGNDEESQLENRIEWLEKEFEEMALDGMEVVEEEETLAEGVDGLAVAERMDES